MPRTEATKERPDPQNPVSLGQEFHAFDAQVTDWTPRPRTRRNQPPLARGEEEPDWGAWRVINLDIGATEEGRALLARYGFQSLPSLTFTLHAQTPETPLYADATITPFSQTAGYNRGDMLQGEVIEGDARTQAAEIVRRTEQRELVDLQKAPLLFTATLLPTEALRHANLVNQRSRGPLDDLTQLLRGLELHLICTSRGEKTYTSQTTPTVLGHFTYRMFTPEGNPNTEPMQIALPGSEKILDQRVQAAFVWKEPPPFLPRS